MVPAIGMLAESNTHGFSVKETEKNAGMFTTVTVVPSLSYSTEKSSYLDTGYLDTYIYGAWQL